MMWGEREKLSAAMAVCFAMLVFKIWIFNKKYSFGQSTPTYMKNIIPLLCIFLVSCNSQPTTVPKKVLAQPIEEKPLTIDEVVAKFSNTPVKTDRTEHGLSDYRDTTYNNQEFTVKDTISYIGADNQGNEYLLLGRIDGTRTSAVKCYFENKADIEKLSVKQVVTVSSKKHFAIIKPVFPGTANPLTMTIVQMQKCNLLDAQTVHNFEVIRTDNRDPIINLDIYTTAKKENLKALNDDVCAIYNPGRD